MLFKVMVATSYGGRTLRHDEVIVVEETEERAAEKAEKKVRAYTRKDRGRQPICPRCLACIGGKSHPEVKAFHVYAAPDGTLLYSLDTHTTPIPASIGDHKI